VAACSEYNVIENKLDLLDSLEEISGALLSAI